MFETNEESIILQNLKYIGLDLEKLPDFLMMYKDVDYKPTKAYEQRDFKVYKYINIKDIQILLTPKNRLDSVIEKYEQALPLAMYLDEKNEENIVRHASFLKMLEKVNKKEIAKIDEEQTEMSKNVPFKVKYDTNYLWEIYYSEFTGKYFMMVTTEDQDYSAFFYLLKKQIECNKNNKNETIFVPVSYMDYTKRYLKKSEISDLEKYIWLFTKDWPKIYEVFDINNDLIIHIVGKTDVYDKIKSYYKIELKTKDDAVKFYTVVKALFILRTELPHHYDFETQISPKGELQFEFNNKVIDYKNISKFIKEEYKKNAKELQRIFDEKEKLDIQLDKLKEEELEKNKEYLFKEKQVATYLECRKSVFGRIKYFFKNKNGKFVRNKNKNLNTKKIKEENEIQKSIANSIIEEKELYTIEDLIKICIELDRINIRIKDNNLDIKALEDKIEVVNNKIKNATLFIEKIEEHKKSIFEFWKFANKDSAIGLNAGTTIKEKEKTKKIKRAFDYEEDTEDLGIEADGIQRDLFNKEETDSIYIANTNELNSINALRNNNNEYLKEKFEEIKKVSENKTGGIEVNSFDIFGNIKNDKTKISVLSNKKHRESLKDKNRIMEISNNTTIEEYTEQINTHIKNINNAMEKTSAITDMDVYLCSNDKLNLNDIKVFYINPTDAIKASNATDKINLYKLKIKKEMNLIYNTNIIYYDNSNNTLPLGMNVKQTVLFDMNKYKLDLKKQKIFRIDRETNDFDFKEMIICGYEYDVNFKEKNK